MQEQVRVLKDAQKLFLSLYLSFCISNLVSRAFQWPLFFPPPLTCLCSVLSVLSYLLSSKVCHFAILHSYHKACLSSYCPNFVSEVSDYLLRFVEKQKSFKNCKLWRNTCCITYLGCQTCRTCNASRQVCRSCPGKLIFTDNPWCWCSETRQCLKCLECFFMPKNMQCTGVVKLA